MVPWSAIFLGCGVQEVWSFWGVVSLGLAVLLGILARLHASILSSCM